MAVRRPAAMQLDLMVVRLTMQGRLGSVAAMVSQHGSTCTEGAAVVEFTCCQRMRVR